MMRGGGGVSGQMRGQNPRMRLPMAQQQQSRRGRPTVQNSVMMSAPHYNALNAQNQQYTNAALGLKPPPRIKLAQLKQQQRQRQLQMQQQQQQQQQHHQQQPQHHQQQQHHPQQQRFPIQQQQPTQAQPQQFAQQQFQAVQAPARPKPTPQQHQPQQQSIQTLPTGLSVQAVPTQGVDPSSSASSWHTPTMANRPVSPPTMKDSNFKIIIPKMGGGLKKEKSPDVIDLDATMSKLPSHLNISRSGGGSSSASSVVSNESGVTRPTVLQQQQSGSVAKLEAIDPLRLPDSPATGGGDKSHSQGGPMVATFSMNSVKSETNIKVEKPVPRPDLNKSPGASGGIKNSTSNSRESNESRDRIDGDWCAVCHDGGDTLYCCDRCPNVYHLYCYIPPLESEPADDWVCLMCETREEILTCSQKVRKN